jgi:hypothetical protein
MSAVQLNHASGGSVTIAPASTATAKTLTAPAVNGNIITSADSGTVTQTMLGTNVAGNGPAFSAYQSVSQSIASGTNVKLQFQTEDFDTASAFDSTTNYRFQPTVAGYYQINGCYFVSSATNNVMACIIYKTGNIWCYGSQTVLSANVVISSASSILYLNGSSDYVELWGYQASGANAASFVSGRACPQFSGCLVRAAQCLSMKN